MRVCGHCGGPVPETSPVAFCCNGCEAAFALLRGLGLDGYYRRRQLDPAQRLLRPEDEARHDFSAQVIDTGKGLRELHLMVEGIHCAACVWLIESLIGRQPGVHWARVNMTTRRLVVRWDPAVTDADAALAPVVAVGYHLVPFDPVKLARETEKHEKDLLRAMAVAGFAAGNVMLFSVSIWAGSDMGPATRTFMHWLSALVAIPAIAWCIRPFLRSALTALAAGRTNMDVPITLGVLLTTGMSLFETIQWGEHAYFDSAIMLLFFLLIGRYLDSRARGQAHAAAQHLLVLEAVSVTVIEADGTQRLVPPDKVAAGQTVLVAAGERIGVDGQVIHGRSDVDTSLISGESVPVAVENGARVFAGTINLSAPLRLVVTAVGERTLLAEIVRMMEMAEQGRARYVALADRVARWYAPVVHSAALTTFLVWRYEFGMDWQPALLNAVAVLIITCPCALALAVPVVQIIGSGRLLRQGILIKSATALERFADVDWVVFDKTGTMTQGKPMLVEGGWTDEDLRIAASVAASSRHPLAKALALACPGVKPVADVIEEPGRGLTSGAIRLGSRRHVGVPEAEDEALGPELWLSRPDTAPVCFRFTDEPRADAARVVETLRRWGLPVELLSGDRSPVVRALAEAVGVREWQAGRTPAEKVARLEELAAQGHRVLMIGDGLNDAPALAAAHVSMSPSSAVDISQTAADIVFQGHRLAPVLEAISVARRSRGLVRQNFVLAVGYNVITVPLAITGHVTPLIAAIAMSASSLVVIVNALRLSRGRAL